MMGVLTEMYARVLEFDKKAANPFYRMKRTEDMSILPMSTILPPAIRERLVAVSKFESRIEFGESDTRAAILDQEIASIKKSHPQFFNQE